MPEAVAMVKSARQRLVAMNGGCGVLRRPATIAGLGNGRVWLLGSRAVMVSPRRGRPQVKPAHQAASALMLTVVAACGGTPRDRLERIAVDTAAGLEIVTSPRDPPGGVLRDLRGARLTELRDSEGRVEEFAQVWGVLLVGASIVVLDGKAPAVVVYEARGQFKYQVGRAGSGPGEYVWPTSVATTTDSLFVWDAALRRLSVFSIDGTSIRSMLIPEASGVSGIRVTETSGLVYQLGPEWASPPSATNGVLRIVTMDGDGNIRRQIVTANDPSSVAWIQPGASSVVAVPFASKPLWGLSAAGKIHFTSGDRYEIAVLRDNGDTVRLVRRRYDDVSLTQEESNWAHAKVSAYAPPFRAKITVPSKKPAITGVVAGNDGCMWIATHDERYPAGRRWDVFDDRGYLVHGVIIDSALTIHAVDKGFVVAVRHDSLGIPGVVTLGTGVACTARRVSSD